MKRKLFALFAFTAAACFAQPHYLNTTLKQAGVTASTQADVSFHTVSANVVSASACTIRLEGSLDNAHWFDLSGSQDCTSGAMFHVDGKPVLFVRVNLLTYTGDASGVAVVYWGTN